LFDDITDSSPGEKSVFTEGERLEDLLEEGVTDALSTER
jgi:hypothetical protein